MIYVYIILLATSTIIVWIDLHVKLRDKSIHDDVGFWLKTSRGSAELHIISIGVDKLKTSLLCVISLYTIGYLSTVSLMEIYIVCCTSFGDTMNSVLFFIPRIWTLATCGVAFCRVR